MKQDLVTLLRESVLVTSVLAVLLVGTACYIWATGHDLPANMTNVMLVVVAFFFGQKVEVSKRSVLEAQARAFEAAALKHSSQ